MLAATLGVAFLLNVDGGVPTGWALAMELGLGLIACLALLVRRRWPVWLALAELVLMTVSVVGWAAAGAAVYTVAAHRPPRYTAAVVACYLPALAFYIFAFHAYAVPAATGSFWATLLTTLLELAVVVGGGLLVRSRRLLMESLRERAHQGEERQRLRLEEARRQERERIAREMHDVLAHRISLLAMHAGALEFRPDAPPADVERAAGVIRSCAYDALEDLREVIGVLRAEDGTGAERGRRPQPVLADLDELVAESRGAGMRLSLLRELDDAASVPAAIGRHAYRVVQEGLTNARKHAPAASVRVGVTGGPGEGLAVEIRNSLPPGTAAAEIPGAGAGLVGLRERLELAGGTIEHGRTPDGDFRLRGWLPWPG
ncbi:sensor histidine kinase [Allonocardiopsis opalescens]|uniref:histidine kinase n=1 Tax=Allonocardiopsis opalescens TaxID=1144618 RepID=A0A2T0Q5F8_9ACTN|nr:histidine kinase [Allonocardiopsis opalescens]PRX99058.1 signal transduction histidine kinase [Allonocardiopsis opalescens]